METQKGWWEDEWNEWVNEAHDLGHRTKSWEELKSFMNAMFVKAINRRDADLLEKVEGMKLTMAERIAAQKTGLGIRNQTLDDVIKLIKK